MALVRIIAADDMTIVEEREYSRVPMIGERVRLGVKTAKVVDVLHEIRGSSSDAVVTVRLRDS